MFEGAIELIKELSRTDGLPPYEEQTVRETINQINSLFEEIKQTMQSNEELKRSVYISSNIIILHSGIGKDKQCILTYLMHRLRRIQMLRWELNAEIPQHIINNQFSQKEAEFLVKYDNMLTEYMQDVGVDLALDYQQPPKELFVVVRVLRDCQLTFRSPHKEPIELKENTTHFLRRSAVEELIRTGYLEHVV